MKQLLFIITFSPFFAFAETGTLQIELNKVEIVKCRLFTIIEPRFRKWGWIDTEVTAHSEDEIRKCPLNTMIDNWSIYRLKSVDHAHCEYEYGDSKLICEKINSANRDHF